LKSEIEQIKIELRNMRRDLEGLKKRYHNNGCNEIKYMLRRRGYDCLRSNPKNGLILPRNFDSSTEDFFYDLMKKYSFRMFLRDVIKLRRSFKVEDLVAYCSEETVKNYIEILLDRGILEGMDSFRYRLLSDSVVSFGDTLEWFIAKIFEKEFYSISSWGINISNTQRGGDFDVISFVEGNFIYSEIKSSPPKHIEINEISSFLDRIEDLQPDLSIFFEDTELRLSDKIVPMFQEELERRSKGYGKKRFSIRGFVEEGDNIFHINEKIFIINSKPDVIRNLGFLLQYFLKNKNTINWIREAEC